MLMENYSQVVEPYTYHFTNSLTNLPEQITQSKDIDVENTLSQLLSNYLTTKQFNNAVDKDGEIIVEHDEAQE